MHASRHIALRLGTGERVGETLLDGPAGTAAPELIECIGNSGEEVGGVRRADLFRLPVAAERLADGVEGRGAGPLADLLGEELRELGARCADVDRVALALEEAHAINTGAVHGSSFPRGVVSARRSAEQRGRRNGWVAGTPRERASPPLSHQPLPLGWL